MSNIEPTEEQRAAVRAIAEKEGARVQLWHLDEIARLLAEREAKLREELEGERSLSEQLFSTNGTLRARVAELTKERDTARAEKRAILTGIGADGADDETAALIVQLRARVAELEARRDHLTEMLLADTRVRIVEQAREAQHLADIKALRRQLDLSNEVVEYVGCYAVLVGVNRDVLARLAHYDDAK